MRSRWLLTVLTTLVLLSLSAGPALADGIIIPEPPPPRPPMPLRSLAIKYHRVSVTVEDQVATTHVDQVFINDNPFDLEGVYLFPIPEEAAISQFSLWVDGQKLEGRVLDRDEARRIYEDIVRKRRDPALLEYVGRNAFQARVFPIPAHGEKRIELEYSQVLRADQGLIRYVYPLNTEKFSTRPLEQVAVRVEIHSRQPIKAVYSPSHPVDVDRPDDLTAVVGYEEEQVTPDTDFVLYYSLSEELVGLNVVSYKEPGEDGFFLLLAAPKVEVEESQVVAKDVFLVLDTSGSMRGEKLEQAKKALTFVLENLNAEDRFNVIAFSTGVRPFARGLQGIDVRDDALRFVRELQAQGGTNIHRALMETLKQADPERPQIIIFLTDGLATEGETDTDRILRDVADAAPETTRLFTFGVGDNVNTLLLDTLAQEHRGASAYVRPGQRVDEAVSAFYAKVSNPVLADLELDFGDLHVEDVYPYPLPDLFVGTQLLLAGRYREGGETTVTLRGTVDGRPQVFRYSSVSFVERGGAGFIPRLWATRKIGYLMDQIRRRGEDKELVDEIVQLSVRYGIITPYTSFLVDEREDVLSEEGRGRVVEKQVEAFRVAPAPTAGAAAVQDSLAREALRAAEVAARPVAEQVRHAGDRAFILRGGVWTDTRFDPKRMQPTLVGFGTDAYFELLARRPDLGPYFALGKEVIVVVDGRAIRVTKGDLGAVELLRSTPAPATPTSGLPAAGPTATPAAGSRDALPEARPTPSSPARRQPGACPGIVVGLLLPAAAVFIRSRWPSPRR